MFIKELLRYLPGEASLVVLGLISVPVLTRLLTPEHFGHYALVMSSVVIAVCLLGSFPMGTLRFYPAVVEEKRRVLLRTSLWAQITSVVAGGSVCLMTVWILWPSNSFLRSLAVAGIAIAASQSIFQLFVEVLRAGRRVEAYNFCRIWSKAAGLAFGIFLAIVFDLGVLGILWGTVIGFLTTLPFLWRSIFAGIQFIGPVSKSLAREVGGFGLPLVVGNIAGWALSLCDRYFIQAYFGSHQVGLYSAAYSISEHTLTMIATFFMLSSTPLLIHVWENQGRQASQRLLVSVTRSYLLVSIPAVAGLSVLAEPIMIVLTGEKFSAGYSIVPWVAAGAFFVGLQHRHNQALRLLKRTRDIMFWLFLAAGLNILLNWWLLPIFGYQMAAVTTFASYLFLCGGQAWASSRHFYWPFPWGTTLRSCASAGVMCVGGLLLKNVLVVSPIALLFVAIPAGMAIYGMCLWALGEVSLAEAKALRVAGKQWINGYGRVQSSKAG